MHARRALFVEPGGDFEAGNHERVGASGNFHRIADMVAVPVRNEDEIRRHFFHINVFGERIARNERVEQQGFAANYDRETGVTVVSDLHAVVAISTGSGVSRKPCKWRTRVGCRSLRSALASIWRMRSRVTLYILPISSSVRS